MRGGARVHPVHYGAWVQNGRTRPEFIQIVIPKRISSASSGSADPIGSRGVFRTNLVLNLLAGSSEWLIELK